MRYSGRYTLNPGVLGAAVEQVMRLSSIHDPDYTGVGHQPLGHDQLSPLFERYQVISVEYEVSFINASTTDVQRVGVRASDVFTGAVNPDQLIENGNVQWSFISPVTGGPCKERFTGVIKLHEVHGITASQYLSNDDYGAAFGANPVEEGYLHLFADGVGSDSGNVQVGVVLNYKVRLMGSKLTDIS
jgi:hypothetical protein